jgi:MFS transporter, UMF1 family
MSTAAWSQSHPTDEKEYKRRINAWTMYDWANSAFATTVLAAVLPIYFSQVAGSTLPSEAVATAYWSLGLSVSLLFVAVLSPILGTISDISRSKKRFLAAFVGIGVTGTALLVLVTTGDWILASILAIMGRIGFNGSIVFYDSLLPHVARPEDQDRVSARGFAIGYLGGGLLLAINVVMIFLLPGTWGPRLSFLSVAIWWAVFSIPLFRRVPEPPAATEELQKGETVIGVSIQRLKETLLDIRRYRQLFKYLIAFLIYNDGIGTIIGVAAIYGAELGFGSIELILALLLVQFVGIPFSLIFGALPSAKDRRRPQYLAFVIFNLVTLPLVGILGSRLLPGELSGTSLPPYPSTASAAGEGISSAESLYWSTTGDWTPVTIPGDDLAPRGLIGFLNNPFAGTPEDAIYLTGSGAGERIEFNFNGQSTQINYATGPDHGIWAVEMDGIPVIDEDTRLPLRIDSYSEFPRYDARERVIATAPGEHVLSLINTGERNPASAGTVMAITSFEVLKPIRQSNLGVIILMILALEAVGAAFAWLAGKPLFSRLAQVMDTKRSIILALVIYAAIAVWGYFLDSTVEFWFLAWMVAIVQGGSQALSRSLYASMVPARKSGEFFGLFGVMEKFASLLGPLLFAFAGLMFGSSRPAILSLIAFFIIGIILLTRVNVAEGKQVAQEEDAKLISTEV